MLSQFPRRLALCAALLLSLAASAVAQITVASQATNTTATYATGSNTVFSNIAVQAGDIFVLAHSNNKNNNGTNTITATMSGISDTLTTYAAPASGGVAGAWLYYTTITTSGTITGITLDTNSATKTVSQGSAYYVLRATGGQTISIGDTQSAAGAASGSKTLNFNFNSNNTDYFAIAVTAVGSTAGVTVVDPAGWTQSVTSGTKREIYYLDSSTGGASTISVTSVVTGGTDVQAFAGLVVITAVPEPSTYAAIFGAAALGLIVYQRRKQRAKQPTA